MDECTTGLNDCEHICVNKHGSYECVCQDGYEPGRNKSTCKGDHHNCNSLQIVSNSGNI